MSELSPVSEKMDTSETTDNSSQEFDATSQALRLSNPKNEEILDNAKSYHESRTNATNSHPLMYIPPISPDFPDLIPKNKNTLHEKHYTHTTPRELNEDHDGLFDVPIYEEYSDKLPDFPESPSAMKKSLMYEMPVDVSHAELSDNENDKSVYEAHLSSNLQNVSLTMNEKEGNLNFLAHGQRSHKLRRVKVMQDNDPDSDVSISSIESVSDSLKSEDVFAGCENEAKDTPENDSPEPIEPLSAADERRHARHWQRMVLPGGEQRTIDMRVIEPYKRVLSHGGYLRAGGHTAIVVFSACFLPDRSRVDYDYVMDNLFLYVLWTLERLVTDDYILVYLHGGAIRLPAFSWLKRCYHMVGRKLRKNLSHLYLVHPTLWIKTMLFMAKPFISTKFYRKITFVGSLRELLVRVPLETAAVPDKVKAYDSLHCRS